jgi:hypothetical protein
VSFWLYSFVMGGYQHFGGTAVPWQYRHCVSPNQTARCHIQGDHSIVFMPFACFLLISHRNCCISLWYFFGSIVTNVCTCAFCKIYRNTFFFKFSLEIVSGCKNCLEQLKKLRNCINVTLIPHTAIKVSAWTLCISCSEDLFISIATYPQWCSVQCRIYPYNNNIPVKQRRLVLIIPYNNNIPVKRRRLVLIIPYNNNIPVKQRRLVLIIPFLQLTIT